MKTAKFSTIYPKLLSVQYICVFMTKFKKLTEENQFQSIRCNNENYLSNYTSLLFAILVDVLQNIKDLCQSVHTRY